MIVLHGGLNDGCILLWAERSEGEARPEGNGHQEANQHPCCAGPGELTDLLAGAVPEFRAESGEAVSVTAWLPSRGGRPIPSSTLLADPSKSRAKPRLAPWTIAANRLSPADAIPILRACDGRGMLTAGVIIGTDLAYWSRALRFAAGLVARQQYLPGVGQDLATPRATWIPLFVGADAERLARLSRRMPASARALSEPDATEPPDLPAEAMLRTFVAAVADHLVRHGTAAPATTPSQSRDKAPAFDSVHDAWLHGLSSADGVIGGVPEQLRRLRTQVMEWQRPIALTAGAPFRLCFRLEEPPEPEDDERESAAVTDDGWYLRYLLQSHEDRSLLLPAGEVWKTGGQRAHDLEREGFNPREFLLACLGRAGSICGGVADSLHRKEPAGQELDAAAAYRFLTRESVALEEAGYGIMLPAWWTRRGTKVRPALRASVKTPRMQGGGGVSLGTMLDLNLEVALGDQVITARELEALAQLKAPLVRLRGQWVELNAGEIRAAVDFWNRRGESSLGDVIRLAVGADETPGGFELEGVAASGWVEELLEQLTGQAEFQEIEVPDGFCGTLRPYQMRGYSWLAFLRRWGLGACLADDMGLGKTVQTLAAMQQDRREGAKGPALLVCPTSVLNNWRKEADRFTPELPLLVHHGPGRKRGAEFVEAARQQAIVIASYGVLARDVQFMSEVPWRGVVLDEAQNIKNPATRQARAARSLEADYRVALTGTPVENHVGDLWSVMEFLNPGLLGTEGEFRRNYFVPIQAERDAAAAQRLQRATGPFILRRLKTDRSIIDDLPEKMESREFCPLTREQATLYEAVLREAEQSLEEAEGIRRQGAILETLTKLKQVCNHPRQLLGDNSAIAGRSGKLARLEEMLEEVIAVGDRALVFSQFAEMGAILQRHVQETFGREALFLHGGVSRRQRDQMVERFQDAGNGPPVFILSLKAGGTGLNLTAANHVFHYDRWWNPAVENQATDRAFRIGQTSNVQVHKFMCAGTLEERIDLMIEAKQATAERVVGAGEGWLTRLSNEELREVLTLDREAVTA